MEEMSIFSLVAKALGLFVLFSEVMLITHYRNMANELVPMTAKLRPVIWMLIINTVMLSAGMYTHYFGTAISAAVTVSSFLMVKTLHGWEKRSHKGAGFRKC